MNNEEIMKKLMEVSKMIRDCKNTDPCPDDRHPGPRPDDRHFGPRPDDRHFGPKEKQILVELLNYDKIDQILFSKELNIIPQESISIFQELDKRNLMSHEHNMENNEITIFLTPEGVKIASILKEEMKQFANEFFKCLNEDQLKEFGDILNMLIVNN